MVITGDLTVFSCAKIIGKSKHRLHSLKTTSTAGSDPSFLKFEMTWHLGLESIILLHEILKRKSLKIKEAVMCVLLMCCSNRRGNQKSHKLQITELSVCTVTQ